MSVHIDPSNPTIIEYRSIQNIHSIKIELDIENHQALINEILISYEAPIELTLLLQYMCCELKKINITTIIQQVYESDWYTILCKIKYFKLINKNTDHNFLNIMCKLSKFPKAYMMSIGYYDPD